MQNYIYALFHNQSMLKACCKDVDISICNLVLKVRNLGKLDFFSIPQRSKFAMKNLKGHTLSPHRSWGVKTIKVQCDFRNFSKKIYHSKDKFIFHSKHYCSERIWPFKTLQNQFWYKQSNNEKIKTIITKDFAFQTTRTNDVLFSKYNGMISLQKSSFDIWACNT